LRHGLSPSTLSAAGCWASVFVLGRSRQRGRPGVGTTVHSPAQQRDKADGTQGRSGASSNKTVVRAADLTRPTADGARGRPLKITGEATLGLAGVELWRPAQHQPCQALALEKGGRPAHRNRRVSPATIAHTCAEFTYAQRHNDTLGEVCRGPLVFPAFVPVQTNPSPSCSEFPSSSRRTSPRTCSSSPLRAASVMTLC
jgi:hypothetical protein